MLYKLAVALTIATSNAAILVEEPTTGYEPRPMWRPVVEPISDPEWEAFKQEYKKSYETPAEERERYQIFQATKQRVARLNAINKKAGDAFGITWMADRKDEEKYKTGYVRPAGWTPTAPVKDYKATRRANPPAALDWQYTEAVTAIKNQGQCGSCWAFSATEAVESALVLSTGSQLRLELSPQQVTSCSPKIGVANPCLGCNGGTTEGAYDYLTTVTGLTNSFNLPYEQSLTATSKTVACPTAKIAAIDGPMMQLTGGYAAVSGYHYAVTPCTSGPCTSQDLAGLQAALETTPVSVCVDASSWNDYTGGVMTAAACGGMAASDIDHCVMATGFNTTAPVPYWIVRNSWSSTWGEYGYIYLEMSENTCGLANDVTIPEVTLDLNDDEKKAAALGRERLYQKAVLAK